MRTQIIQSIIKWIDGRLYLEIGVETGINFLPIRCERKIGVDPEFFMSPEQKVQSDSVQYYEITSDEFFDKHSDLFSEKKIDVAFIDGLHNHEQSLKDVENCLKHLDEKGVIVMHDCNPPSASSAAPTMEQGERMEGWTTEWCGDVWKTIAYLRSLRKDLKVLVLNCDYGLGIITRGEPENMLDYSEEDIRNMSYEDLEKDKEKILNLKRADYLVDFLCGLK